MDRDMIINTITSRVYYELFGLTRDELIDHVVTDPQAVPPGADFDAIIRDCMSLEALDALHTVEGQIANYYQRDVRGGVSAMMQLAAETAQNYRVAHGTIPLWHDE